MYNSEREIWDKLYAAGSTMLTHEKDFAKIHKHLLTIYNDEALVFAVIKKIKSEHHAVEAQLGRKLLIIGLLFLLAGFIITCVNYHSNRSITFPLYGLTSIGLIILLYGLYKIIG